MPGSNNGTGHRLNARCSKCAKDYVIRNGRCESTGKGYRLKLTGRRKRSSNGGNGGRVDTMHVYEVECYDCGHVGWTRHITIANRWKDEEVAKRQIEELGRS